MFLHDLLSEMKSTDTTHQKKKSRAKRPTKRGSGKGQKKKSAKVPGKTAKRGRRKN